MAKRRGILGEFALFIRAHKAYWLTPIVVVVVLMVGLIVVGAFGGGAAAPFIYSLF